MRFFKNKTDSRSDGTRSSVRSSTNVAFFCLLRRYPLGSYSSLKRVEFLVVVLVFVLVVERY